MLIIVPNSQFSIETLHNSKYAQKVQSFNVLQFSLKYVVYGIFGILPFKSLSGLALHVIFGSVRLSVCFSAKLK
jgi:hypothetical protein